VNILGTQAYARIFQYAGRGGEGGEWRAQKHRCGLNGLNFNQQLPYKFDSLPGGFIHFPVTGDERPVQIRNHGAIESEREIFATDF
jgi:hypothetical protein